MKKISKIIVSFMLATTLVLSFAPVGNLKATVDGLVGENTSPITIQPNAVAFPAAINEVFPDVNVASKIASDLGKNVLDSVTLADLQTITSFDVHTLPPLNVVILKECNI